MILKTNDRADLFGAAKSLNPILGDIFQNPMELTTEIIQREIDQTRSLLKKEQARYNAYIFKLGDLICFPEKFR